MHSYCFICPLPNGMHARPASEFEQRASNFQAEISLHNLTKNKQADAKSVLSLISADITFDDKCELHCHGIDAEQALLVLSQFIENELAHCDAPLTAKVAQDEQEMPLSLACHQPNYLRGRILSKGLAIAQPWFLNTIDLQQVANQCSTNLSEEQTQQQLITAIQNVVEQLKDANKQAEGEDYNVLAAHLKIIQDVQFSQTILQHANLKHPIRAIANAATELKKSLLQSSSVYLQERALDIDDLCLRLASCFGVKFKTKVPQVPFIVIAKQVTPGQLLSFPRDLLAGMLLQDAGETSHTVILARAFDIPLLTDININEQSILSASSIILDANLGVVIYATNPGIDRFYQLEQQKQQRFRQRLLPFRQGKGCSADGIVLEIAANIASATEAESAFNNGAESIGLFRTEMLFMDRESAPDEEEQYLQYHQVIDAAQGRRVIIRTLDIGGDKPLPYLSLRHEENPFLGYRAVRLYPQFISLFEQQVRALLRASLHGPVDIMIPMITTQQEVEWVYSVFKRCEQQVNHKLSNDDRGTKNWRLGIMVEVPSALYLLDRVGQWIDFISIGSNDLCQYTLACDRGDNRLAAIYHPLQPTFLHLVKDIIYRAKTAGLATGLCGEMGADPMALPLLLAMGIDEISMASPKIAQSRALLASLDSSSCQQLLEEVLNADSVEMVKEKIHYWLQQQGKPAIIATELVLHNVQANNKHEIIKLLTDNLEVNQRVSSAAHIERAIWQREEIFSTALGFAIALPHCKSEHVLHNSVSVAHLAQSIVWSDDNEISTVIMLTVNERDAEDNTHMKIFSRLARKLIHNEFRCQLTGCDSSQATVDLLHEHVIAAV